MKESYEIFSNILLFDIECPKINQIFNKHVLKQQAALEYCLGSFYTKDTNYIVCRNVETLGRKKRNFFFSKNKAFVEEDRESYEIFSNILLFDTK